MRVFTLHTSHTGDYFLIDPFNGEISSFSLGKKFMEDLILEVKVFSNGCAFMTKTYKFYSVVDAYNPFPVRFVSEDNLFKEKPVHWIVVPPK